MDHVNCFGKHFAFFVSKGYFKFPRLGGTHPSSGILYILNAKACCSGCVLSLFIRVPVTSMCGVVVVGVCVSTYIYVYRSCIDIYRYGIFPIELSPTAQSKGGSADAQHEVHCLSQPRSEAYF